tara:strand:+ start:40 stop:957 length:918 start_codon:yes stop_codon:yes gene_type:complete
LLEIFYHPIYTNGISIDSKFPRDRYKLIFESILKSSKNYNINFRTPEKIKIGDIYKVHQKKYVDDFINGFLTESQQRKIGLRPWTSQIVERTLYIMGGSVSALKSAIENGASGNLAGGTHHAYYDFGSGYCIFNDLAICADYCLRNFTDIKNILIIDLDVHQGDGTAAMLKDEDSVYTFSMHCESNFPLKKQQSDLDIGLKRNLGDNDYLKELSSTLEKLENRNIDIVFFQAGVDTLIFDSLGNLNLSHEGLKKRNELVFSFCKKQNTPIVVFMGGGYSNPIDHTVNAVSELFYQCRDFTEQFKI